MSDPASITPSNTEMIAWLESTALYLDPRTEEWRTKEGIITGYERDAAMLRTIAAALAQPARAQAGVAELVAKWRAEAESIARERQDNASAPGLLWHGEKQGRERALRECADALAALNGGEDGK